MFKFTFTFMAGVLALSLITPNAYSQDTTDVPEGTKVRKEYNFKLLGKPDGYAFNQSAFYYWIGKDAYNTRNTSMANLDATIKKLKVNPMGLNYSVLLTKKKNNELSIFDITTADKKLATIKNKIYGNPCAMGYSPDAKSMLVATESGLHILDSRTLINTGTLPIDFQPDDIFMSSNGYYLVLTKDNDVYVYNYETQKLRKKLQFVDKINSIVFSNDNSSLAVATADGIVTVYDTRSFLPKQTIEGLGEARSIAYNPDDKFLAVIIAPERIALINMFDEDEPREFIEKGEGSDMSHIRFLEEWSGRVLLGFNNGNVWTYSVMNELTPNYTKMVAGELDDMMNDWMKRMPDESMDAYQMRVNDETRAKQMRTFEQEISTRLAGNLVEMSEVSFGKYNTTNDALAVNFDNMPTIYLNVPEEEVSFFTNPNDLQFNNVKYGLTANDKFEMIYADVYNNANQKSYVFDNVERKPLDFMTGDDNIVSLELIQQSQMEELKLQEIKEKVMEEAKEQNLISNHTNIAVNSRIVPNFNADGEKILNYRVDITYEVDPSFSAVEDFAPGKYRHDESGAASSMLSIVKNAFEGDFAQYVKAGKKLNVKITGMADSMPIHGVIKYDGCYGDFVDEPVYKNGELTGLSVNAKQGITQNEQLAFLRAVGVKDFLQRNVNNLSEMNTNYQYHIVLTEGKGGEFRRINVEFIFVDAL